MSGVEASDAAGKIKQPVAVNIFDDRSFRLGDEDRRGMISGLHNGSIAPLHKRLRARSGNRCAQLNGRHNSVLSSQLSVVSCQFSVKAGSAKSVLLTPTTGH